PAIYLGAASVSPVFFGAQDISAHEKGAFTGEISATQIAETGTKFTIVGHSERRKNACESCDMVASKALMAHRAGLIPIICVGDDVDCDGEICKDSYSAIEMKVRKSIPAEFTKHPAEFIIAYEPVWAIGTNKIPSALDIEQMHTHINKVLRDMHIAAPIIYGGSVNAENAKEIFGIKNVSGFLVGRASLTPETFIPIITVVS
ncbi:MAG: triose-phosphate isomerase, partial [Alphaproteobacteria bacterium]|nr:triose-phosphate isomerase [Alphaproteobacteria bacterium]